MPRYIPGCTRIRQNNQNITSILDIDFGNGLWIYVFPGTISQNDIWIKFRDYNIPRSKIRTPKHIHWAVDILLKNLVTPGLLMLF